MQTFIPVDHKGDIFVRNNMEPDQTQIASCMTFDQCTAPQNISETEMNCTKFGGYWMHTTISALEKGVAVLLPDEYTK